MLFWCHIRHLNPLKIHPERITQKDNELSDMLDYEGIKFPVSKNDFIEIEMINKICVNVFCYENKLPFQFSFQIKNLKTQWICCIYLMVINHIMCISNILTDLCLVKQKAKTNLIFVKAVYSALAVKMY